MPSSALWQDLSRHLIVGTDQMPMQPDLRARLAALGIRDADTLPDTLLLQKALTLTGMLEKTTAEPTQAVAPTFFEMPDGWSQAPETKLWFGAVFEPKSEPILVWLVEQLHAQRKLFPAVWLPDLVQIAIRRRLWDSIALFDARVLAWVAAIPKYQDDIADVLRKREKALKKQESEPIITFTPTEARAGILALAYGAAEKKDVFGAEWQVILPFAAPELTIPEQKDLLDRSFQLLSSNAYGRTVEQFNAWMAVLVVHLDPATVLYVVEQHQTQLAALNDTLKLKDVYRLAVLKEQLVAWLQEG